MGYNIADGVEGPKGKLSRKLSDRINIEIKDGTLLVKRVADTKMDKSLHGLFRALIVNMIVGVTQGYLKELEIQGVGFNAKDDNLLVSGNMYNFEQVILNLIKNSIDAIEEKKRTRSSTRAKSRLSPIMKQVMPL